MSLPSDNLFEYISSARREWVDFLISELDEMPVGGHDLTVMGRTPIYEVGNGNLTFTLVYSVDLGDTARIVARVSVEIDQRRATVRFIPIHNADEWGLKPVESFTTPDVAKIYSLINSKLKTFYARRDITAALFRISGVLA